MSEETVILPKETTRALIELTGEARADVALTLVIRDYARYKLAEIDAALRRYEENMECRLRHISKYGRLRIGRNITLTIRNGIIWSGRRWSRAASG